MYLTPALLLYRYTNNNIMKIDNHRMFDGEVAKKNPSNDGGEVADLYNRIYVRGTEKVKMQTSLACGGDCGSDDVKMGVRRNESPFEGRECE